MSDIDSELLELVEDGGQDKKKRKRSKTSTKSSKASSSKRRKAEVSDSENEVESEEDVDSNPYPYEGRFVDEADKQRLMQMSEIEREDILTQRDDELQIIADKRLLVQYQENGQGQTEAVSDAAKRNHTARGATKEKSKKLDELKAKRRAKDQKGAGKGSSPVRERSSSPMDMETSDEDEDGQITKNDQDSERLGRSSSFRDDSPVTREHLLKVMVTRDQLVKMHKTPWFGDYAKGAWVRFLIGADAQKNNTYRVCQITNISLGSAKPYKIDNKTFDIELELTHGKSIKLFTMERVSNSEISDREFDRLKWQCEEDKQTFPSVRDIMVRHDEMASWWTKPMTDADISIMLQRRNTANAGKPANWLALEKSRLAQARVLAQGRHDYIEVKEIDLKIAVLEADGDPGLRRDAQNKLQQLSEKNRKANAEAVRRRELQEAERKRKERKLAASAKSGTATPIANRLQSASLNENGSRTSSPNPSFSSVPNVLTEITATPALATPENATLADSFSLDIDF